MTLAAYILCVVGCNVLFTTLPPVSLFGQMIPPASLLAGGVFVVRDFAHRNHPRAVIAAMAVATLISYALASPVIAVASAAAFAVSEAADYAVFRWSSGSFWRRVLLSSAIAVTLDTALFLAGIGALSWPTALMMSIAKMVALVAVAVRRRP
jgi:uncharacterized PurR-regulated membrane protein YhhQ (DUF165 family)